MLFRSGQELKIDTIRVGHTAGGTNAGSGQFDKGHPTDVGVFFRPVIDGLSNVNHDHGNLMVSVDNDGTVTSLRDTTRPIADIRKIDAFSGPKLPRQKGDDITKLLHDGIKGRYGRAKVTLLTHTVSVGYDFSGKTGNLVAQALFDIDFGHNMHKQAQIRVPVTAA